MKTYSDGTPITAPFWVVKCTSCSFHGWTVLRHDTCPECGEKAECIPANKDKKMPA